MSELDWIDDFIPSTEGIRLKELREEGITEKDGQWRYINGHPVLIGGGGGGGGGGTTLGEKKKVPITAKKLKADIAKAGGSVSTQSKKLVYDKSGGNIAGNSHVSTSQGAGIEVSGGKYSDFMITTNHRKKSNAPGATIQDAIEADRQAFKQTVSHLESLGYEIIPSKAPGREDFDAIVKSKYE